jgi:hypothetical protein
LKYKKVNCFYFLIFLFLSLSFLDIVSTNAATYYVDQNHPNASDSNPGTEAFPWRTPNKAAQMMVAGDTVLIKEGSYFVGSGDWYLPALNPSNSGTPGNPIIFRAYPGHSVKLTATMKVIGAYQRDYIEWDGFIVETTNYSSNSEGACAIVSANYITIKNCELIGHTVNINDNHQAIWMQNASNIIIKNNIIRGVKGGNGSAGIKAYNTQNVLIENNEIYDCDTGIQSKHHGENWTIRYNYIHNCETGFVGGNSTDQSYNYYFYIYQNIFANLSFRALDPVGNFRYGKVYNNVFYNSGSSFVWGWSWGTWNAEFWNNIIVKSFGTLYPCGDWYGTYTVDYWNYNAYSASSIVFEGSRNFSQWQGLGRDLNSFISDPLLVNAASGNFHLATNSPCLNAGIDRQDYDGDGNTNERINMGAYITGNEIIGVIPSGDSTPPSPPKNLRILQ